MCPNDYFKGLSLADHVLLKKKKTKKTKKKTSTYS